ncbi:DUF1330 domain-containing protein [Mucilaginibacter sp. Bleaf8]|uniref:DUF1330 domain-containing protein n=1 Tax=Mucilaginibacter sp. Bleaf8 TaxID=2834430 RepID=UPI001BCD4D2A|nr:DUF1330 domain-containing protein [Mucilaginibacter sp. Bleaf8]MBS7564791.1 DUF1330 domain-containing protein [Mucilaginibacter sp. Bleaf8]
MIQLPEIELGQGPVLMLNLVKFKDRKIYFEQYVPAFGEVVKQLGIQGVNVKVVSDVLANIIAEESDEWDEVMLVEYPSAEAFKAIAESEAYQTLANPLRLAATEKLKLIMTREFKL